MHFQNFDTTFFLVCLAVLGFAAATVVYGHHRRRRRLAQVAGASLLPGLTASLDPGKRRLRLCLWVAGLLLLLGAMARPWWGSQLVPSPKHSRDLLFVLDCSRSMLAKDIPPSRLEHAKWWVRELVAKCPGDRFGIIAFAGDAYLECPLTQDSNTIHQFLEAMDTRTVAAGGTNIALALETAQKAFKAAEGSHQAMVLISDGDELEGDSRQAVEYFAKNQVPLFVVGIGDPERGAPIQVAAENPREAANGHAGKPQLEFLRDNEGKMVVSKLNEAGLRFLSDKTGGIYVRSTAIAPNLLPVAERVRQLVPAEHTGGTEQRPIERFHVPLLLAVLLLLARLFIGERRGPAQPAGLAATGALAVLLALGLAAPTGQAQGAKDVAQPSAGKQQVADAEMPPAPPPRPLIQPLPPDGRARPGQPLATTPQVQAPPSPEAQQAQAQAAAAKREKDLRQGLVAARQELESAAPEHKSRLHFNVGYLHQQLGELDEAEKEYQQAVGDSAAPAAVRGAASQNLATLRHATARQKLATDPDAALADLQAAAICNRDALRTLPGNTEIARNQELLLRDQKAAEQIKQVLEQLKELMQKAQQETGEALKQQTEANQAKTPPERQAQQEKASQQAQTAQQATDALAQAAEQVMSQEGADHFKGISKDVKDARQAQEQADQAPRTEEAKREAGEKAAQHLTDAFTKLGGKTEQQQQKQDGQQQNTQKSDTQQSQSSQQQAGKDAKEQAKDAIAKALDEQKKATDAAKSGDRQQPQQQQAAHEQTQQAESQTQKCAEQAEKNGAKEDAAKAQQAAQALDAAQDAQKQALGSADRDAKVAAASQAEAKLKEALAALDGSQTAEPRDDKPVDEAQAMAILRQVQEQEQQLREAMKQQRRDRRLGAPDKDW